MRNAKFIFALLCAAAIGTLFVDDKDGGSATVPAAAASETYRLVHAIGNDESIVAKGLSEYACQSMKAERAKLVLALGVGGSVTCLPDSLL